MAGRDGAATVLGIDYALFIVMRFRGALFGSEAPVEHAVAGPLPL